MDSPSSFLYYPCKLSFPFLLLLLLFLFINHSLLLLLHIFQALHKTGFLHWLLLILFQFCKQLFFINSISENHRLYNGNQKRDK